MKDGWKIAMVSTLPQNIYLAQSLLESEGIPTLLQDELTAQVHNFYSNAIGGVKMLVPDEEAERAMQLLTEAGYIDAPRPPAETVYASDHRHCPYCGSSEIRKQKNDELLGWLRIFMGRLSSPIRPDYLCFDCGKSWKF